MKKRPRIAFAIPAMSVGGTELQLLRLIRGLQNEFEITLICMREGGALIGDARRSGAYVRNVHARSGWDFTAAARLRRVLQAHTPHVLHSFLFGFDLWANLAARRVGVPVVISSRRELATWQRRRHLYIQRRANRLVDCIAANSQAAADYAIDREQAAPTLFRVIHNGVNAEQYVTRMDRIQLRKRYRIPASANFVVGMVANFSPVKDHELFVEMAARLVQRRKDVHFLFVGTGPLVESIYRLIVKRDLRHHFDRIITLNEMADVMAVLDVSVLCSKMEGFPNAVMESMAAGLPVVASDAGGIKELIRDGETGQLIPSRSADDFGEAVNTLLDQPGERARLGANAAAWVREHLAEAKMIRAYRDLYAELLLAKMGSRSPLAE